jgi:hypothetical protein
MAKAKITLLDNGPLTYNGHGRVLARGQSFVTTNESEILTFQAEHGFSVEMLEGTKPRAAAALTPDESDEDFDHGDAGGPKAAKAKKGKPSKPAPAPEADEEADDDEEPEEPTPADGKLTEAELTKQTKASLRELAEERGVKVDTNANKDALVAALLAAQDADGDDDEADDEG